MVPPSLTVVISTVNENFNRFIKNFRFDFLIDADEVIIIIQGSTKRSMHKSLKAFKVIFDESYGLSESRNAGIDEASSDFIWFLDDDIILDNGSIKRLKNHLKLNQDYHLHVARIKNIDNTPYKIYTKKKILGRINAFSVSSVELIVSKNFINENNIRFNKNLGLGSKYPSTEENFFYLDVFDNGGSIIHLHDFLIKHDFVDRKTIHFRNKFILKAKGAFCRRYGGILGCLILFYFSIKCLSVSKNLHFLSYLFLGFINAEKIIGLDYE